MMLKIASRNILRQKRRTILTVLTMFGGFTLAAFSIGFSDGSYSYIINMFTRTRLGHIQLHSQGYLEKPAIYKTIDNYDSSSRIIAEVEGVTALAPRVYSTALASVGNKSAGVQITGIDPALEKIATSFDKKIIKGKGLLEKASQEVVLGKGLAGVLKAEPGGQLVLVSQSSDGSIANDVYEIAGIAESGDEISDRMALFMHIDDAREFLVLGNKVHEIAVLIEDIGRVRYTAKEIERRLSDPSISVQPWQEFAKAFYEAMRADQQGMWIMLFIIVLIVAVGVLNTVLMSVLERRREYGLLKALGSRPYQIVLLVMWEVNVLAVISIIFGSLTGSVANYIVSLYGIGLPDPFTYGGVEFSRMYAEVSARSLYLPAITVMISANLVSIFPAIKAARIDPAKSMRVH